MSVHASAARDRRCHCHDAPVMPPSASESVAVTAVPSSGDVVDKLTVPGSSTLVTVTITARIDFSDPSPASTVTSYTLSCLPASLGGFPASAAASKSGGDPKRRTPSTSVNAAVSTPARDQMIAVPPGSVA